VVDDADFEPPTMFDDAPTMLKNDEATTSEDGGLEFVPGEIQIHLGSNLYAAAKKSFQTVDIRHFFFTDNSARSLHPTRRGVNLNRYEFKKLQLYLPELENVWYGLAELCECVKSHSTATQRLECAHCTPTPENQGRRVEPTPSPRSSLIAQVPTTPTSPTPGPSSAIDAVDYSKKRRHTGNRPNPTSLQSVPTIPLASDDKTVRKHVVKKTPDTYGTDESEPEDEDNSVVVISDEADHVVLPMKKRKVNLQ